MRAPPRGPLRPLRFAPGVALIVVALVVMAAGGGSVAGDATAMALAGIGGVLVVAAAFWEIGASEDRRRRSGRS